jgi:hypothetical protein
MKRRMAILALVVPMMASLALATGTPAAPTVVAGRSGLAGQVTWQPAGSSRMPL